MRNRIRLADQMDSPSSDEATKPRWKIALTLAAVVCIALPSTPFASAANPVQSTLPPPLNAATLNAQKSDAASSPEQLLDCPAKFITATCADTDGNYWIGTEDQGIFLYVPGGAFVAPLSADVQGPLSVLTPLPSKVASSRSATTTSPYRQFTVADGLGDNNAYALACDRLGRIWVGHLNHGVSVYNGKKWQNYNIIAGLARDGQPNSDPQPSLAGPNGARVFAIATCPTDGDIWIATEVGLSRYSLSNDVWVYYTRAEGLPSDQASSLAFNKQGDIFVGTQCDGIAIARAIDNYKTWTVTPGPEKMPITPTGTGLPSALINCLLVTEGSSGESHKALPSGSVVIAHPPPSALPETIYAGTTTGLAWSTDNGITWSYIRGRDYADKVNGLYGGPPKGWTSPAKDVQSALLAEDYITCLSEDAQSRIFVGHRERGYEILDGKSKQPIFASSAHSKLAKLDGYVNAILASRASPESSGDVFHTRIPEPIAGDSVHGTSAFPIPPTIPSTSLKSITLSRPKAITTPLTLIARYGSGASLLFHNLKTLDLVAPNAQSANQESAIPFPLAARPPTMIELTTMLASLEKACTTGAPGNTSVVPLPDDWVTQGDYLGRYGRYWVCLAATLSPYDFVWGAGSKNISYFTRIGPNHRKGDSVRYWIHWLYTANHRSLELPQTYLDSRLAKKLTKPDVSRRQSEWDDHGEAYDRSHEGPDTYISLRVPEGRFMLSLYDFNKDGHTGIARYRDYSVSIRQHPSMDLTDITDFKSQPELAHSRIRDFWGGMYKRFLVQGPIMLTVQINRNYSRTTILAGIMLDLLDENPPPYFETWDHWASRQASTSEMVTIGSTTPLNGLVLKGIQLLDKLRSVAPGRYAYVAQRSYLALIRWLTATSQSRVKTDTPSVATCLYRLGLYTRWEEQQRTMNLCPARDIEKSLHWKGQKDTDDDECNRLVIAAVAMRPTDSKKP
jgi:hypothetical protein